MDERLLAIPLMWFVIVWFKPKKLLVPFLLFWFGVIFIVFGARKRGPGRKAVRVPRADKGGR